MGDWKIVVPTEDPVANEMLDPSFEYWSGVSFTPLAGAVTTRSKSYSLFGRWSLRVTTGGDNRGVRLTFAAPLATAKDYVISMYVKGLADNDAWDWSVNDTNYHQPARDYSAGDGWYRYSYKFPAVEASLMSYLYIRQNGSTSLDFYLDAVQAEQHITGADLGTTYIDGGQPDCYWREEHHNSASVRRANVRSGGYIKDLKDDYGLGVVAVIGAGTPKRQTHVDEYALLPGGAINNSRDRVRDLRLVCNVLSCDSFSHFHKARQALIKLLIPENEKVGEDGQQPLRLRYLGGGDAKDIYVHYASGLEGNWQLETTTNKQYERITIQFIAPDPFWYGVGEEAQDLSVANPFAWYYTHGRVLGKWGEYLNSNTLVAPFHFNRIAVNPLNRTAYLVGKFQNFSGIAAADNIVARDIYQDASVWQAVGNPITDLNITDLAFAPNGDMYVVGDATVVADRFAKWNGSAWSQVGGGGINAIIHTIIYGHSEPGPHLWFLGGAFTQVGSGPTAANRVAEFDGSIWTAIGVGVGGGFNNSVYSLLLTSKDILWAGGIFTQTIGGTPLNRISKFNEVTGAWEPVGERTSGGGFDGSVWHMVEAPNGDVYACGNFTTADGVAAAGIAKWNGYTWEPLGPGLSSSTGPPMNVYAMAFDSEGNLWIGGNFDQIATNPPTPLLGGLVMWTGSTFVQPPLNLNQDFVAPIVSETVEEIATFEDDILMAAIDTFGAMVYPTTTTLDHTHSRPSYPKLYVERSVGSSAKLLYFANRRTGARVHLDYALMESEVVYLDTRPEHQMLYSTFYGPQPQALQPGENIPALWFLPGENPIDVFVSNNASIIDAWAIWPKTFESAD